nr:hypothetical protein [Tanacetum cinerariifolium]
MAAAMKYMASSFAKLEKFEGVNFRRWQKKMHFMLSCMSVVYMQTTPMLKDGGENLTMKQVRKRAKWDNDDYVCRGLILNEAKYMAEDASSKKFLVSNFTNYKMTNSRQVLEQYNELLGILGRFTQHKINMDESIQVSCIFDKLPPSWKDFKHTLKHLKEELTLIELVSHLRIEEFLRVQDSDKPKGNNIVGPLVVNMCGKPGHLKKDYKAGNVGNKANGSSTKGSEDGSSNPMKGQNRCWFKTYESLNDGSIRQMGNESTALVHGRGCVDLRFSSGKVVSLLNVLNVPNIRKNLVSSSVLNNCGNKQHARLGHVHFKRMQDMSKDGLIPVINMDTEKCKTCMLNKITKKPFQNVKHETKVLELIHSDLCDLHATPLLGNKKYFVTFINGASRFCYVCLLHSKDEALDKFKVFKTEVELKQESLIRRFKTDRGFAINSIIESRDAIFDEHRFSSVPRPSQRSLVKGSEDSGGSVVSKRDVVFWKETITDEMDSIMGNNTWVLTDLPLGCRPLGCRPLEIDYFDTYAPVARISAIRLLIAMASIHNLIIHQMDAKIAFLNEELEEGVYMNQPLGFIMPTNENKVCKLIKSMYGRKQAPKQWHQKFDEVVLSNGYLLNQAEKCMYSKFDASGEGVIICLYLDDMLIFGTNQVQVDLTKEFLSSRFSMKDMRALMPNRGLAVSQLEYSKVIGCLMYVMTCTKPDIAFAMGKLSRLVYSGYPSVLEGYINASWISKTEDNSSTSGWVFLLGGAVGKEAEWLKNLLFEIPLWVKPMAPISINCDSAAALAKAYSQIYNRKSRHLVNSLTEWYSSVVAGNILQRIDGFSFVTL